MASIRNKRNLPWKGEKDIYKIWLSEIMLQQTKAETVIPYYQKIIHTYPTIQHLAKASLQEVFKLWEGLGYYSRCKNMITTAKEITDSYDGKFPEEYHQLLQLKGIGTYTAAAISSFGFKKPHPVIDGNVYRILSRFLIWIYL